VAVKQAARQATEAGTLKTIVVVDEREDTTQVLRAVLEPRGMAVERIRRLVDAPKSSSRRADVVVLDAEVIDPPDADCGLWPNVPRIILGAATFPAREESGTSSPASNDLPHTLCKPFEYRDLIRAIETLLASSPRAA
jgi:hypothetical protein